MTELERILAFLRALDERCAEQIVASQFGPVFVNERYSYVYDLNFLRADDTADASGEELAAEAERIQGRFGLGHRKVSVMDEGVGGRLAPRFDALGWKATWYVVMALRRESARQSDRGAVREFSAAHLRHVWTEGLRSAPFGQNEDVVQQLLDAKDVVAAAVPTRYYAVEVDGEPAAYCELYSAGGLGQVEAVFTRDAYRNRGLASALVAEAVAQSRRDGNDVTFLVALADDWPKDLYERLGFETVGRYAEFLKSPA